MGRGGVGGKHHTDAHVPRMAGRGAQAYTLLMPSTLIDDAPQREALNMIPGGAKWGLF